MKIEPVVLEGAHVRLEPLAADHAPELWEAAKAEELWRFMPFAVASEDAARGLIAMAGHWLDTGEGLGFAIRERSGGSFVGSTAFLAAAPHYRRVEIGATWVTPGWQRTPVNTEAKLLLLRHVFETLGWNRVEFKTDARNARSRAALTRIGAVEEGTLRSHMILPDGHVRDSVYFSIIADEWPATRAHLESLLARIS